MERRVRPYEWNKALNEDSHRFGDTIEREQRLAPQMLHDHEGPSQRFVVALEQIGTWYGIAGVLQSVHGPCFTRAFLWLHASAIDLQDKWAASGNVCATPTR